MVTSEISQYYILADALNGIAASICLSLCLLMLWQAPTRLFNQIAAAWMGFAFLGLISRISLQVDAQFDIFSPLTQLHVLNMSLSIGACAAYFYGMLMLKYFEPWSQRVRAVIGYGMLAVLVTLVVSMAVGLLNYTPIEKAQLDPYTGMALDMAMLSESGNLLLALLLLFIVIHIVAPFVFAWRVRNRNGWLWFAMIIHVVGLFGHSLLGDLGGVWGAITPTGLIVLTLLAVGYVILKDKLFDPMLEMNQQLQRTNAELEETNANIEQKVQERTEALKAALDREHQLSIDLENALAVETRLNDLKTHIMRTISHEFRTPLTAINNSTQLLVKYHDRMTPEKRVTQQTRIQAAIKRLTTLLDDVVLAGRVGSAHSEIKLVPQSLGMLFLNIRDALMHELGNPERLYFGLEGRQSKTFVTDQTMLLYILRILTTNAMQYSELNDAVEVLFNIEDDALMIRVRDEGIGIAAEDLGQIFDLMYRGSNINERDGLGIGLHLVKSMVQTLGGTITVTSLGSGFGSEFVVCLPKIDHDVSSSMLRAAAALV